MANPNVAGPGSRSEEQRYAGKSELTTEQARRFLRYYGYTGIANLHLNGDGDWQAQATHDGRRVRVVIEHRGTALEEK